VQFSVQSNHIHLLVEASDRKRVSRGMKGFAVRVARNVNLLLSTRGGVWGDRYYARALTTPREVRNALVHVLFSRHKHGGTAALDPCSSALFFSGWRSLVDERNRGHFRRAGPKKPMPLVTSPVAASQTWLMNVGWRRWGLLAAGERPRTAT
jgi:putative transposase